MRRNPSSSYLVLSLLWQPVMACRMVGGNSEEQWTHGYCTYPLRALKQCLSRLKEDCFLRPNIFSFGDQGMRNSPGWFCAGAGFWGGVGRATSWFAHCHLRRIHRSRDGKRAREYLMLQAWPSRALSGRFDCGVKSQVPTCVIFQGLLPPLQA